MTALKSKRGKASQFLMASTSDTLQVNSLSCLLEPLLNEIVEVCLYNFCKNAAILILLAQAAAEIDENHHVKTKNAIPSIDVILIK